MRKGNIGKSGLLFVRLVGRKLRSTFHSLPKVRGDIFQFAPFIFCGHTITAILCGCDTALPESSLLNEPQKMARIVGSRQEELQ